jgi:hypothetical protein
MKVTVVVMDFKLNFRLAAIPHTPYPEAWELEVLALNDAASALKSIGLIDGDAAKKLTDVGRPLGPESGLPTVLLSEVADCIEVVCPGDELKNPGEKDAHMLLVQGETTEDQLIASGFVPRMAGLIQ